MFAFFRAILNGIRSAFSTAWTIYNFCFGWLLDAFYPGAREAMSQPTSPDRTDEFAAKEMFESVKAEAAKPILGTFADAATQTIDFCRSDDPWACDLSRVPERARRVLTMLSDDERAVIGRSLYCDIDAWIHERYTAVPIAPVADYLAIDEAAEAFERRDSALSEIAYDGLFGIGDEAAQLRLN
ncbi:hypothetical protein [Pleomorphomonas carboxyditropha]|uniref:Uncharacterized protein n=1 Tax=Pleomorphomonas carboxyditropha TaxID=2023338 RepID=A0A2G9X149_9HYPH|nr:hypothetical protein [Pleomorphomonas carboxyditropha]PIP00698.1 hypothetical protein CJ014_00920 [Pleomorphomonas carboxyditropha]